MDYDMNWLEEIGLDTKSGIGYTGGRDKYLSALQRFYKNYDRNSAKVNDFLAGEDYENYRITVHALKSNAKMIGAPVLSEAFEKLELAAGEGDTGTIKADTPDVLREYGTLVEKLAPIDELGDVRAADEISGEEARKIATELLEALDDFDDDGSKELLQRLSGYPFRLTQQELLKNATEYLYDFLYDEAADVIRELLPAIED